MMTYRRDSKSKVLIYGSIAALCFLFLWLMLPYGRQAVTLFAEYTGIAHTALYQKSAQVISGISMYVRSNTALYEELRKSQQENSILQSEILLLNNYKDIATLFELNADSGERIMTERIGRVDGFLYNSFRVLKRTTACENPFALGPHRILLGTVTNTNSYTALVQTAWNGESTVGQLGASSTPVTLTGEQDGTYTARIPKTTNVEKGDVVTLDANPSIIIGVISFIDQNVHENETLLTIQIPFSPQQIRDVELFCPYE